MYIIVPSAELVAAALAISDELMAASWAKACVEASRLAAVSVIFFIVIPWSFRPRSVDDHMCVCKGFLID